jgi:hypothetical protein
VSALFNWSIITYQGSRVPKELTHFEHGTELWWYLVGPPS